MRHVGRAPNQIVIGLPPRSLDVAHRRQVERVSLAGEQRELQEKMGSLSKLLGDRASLLKAIEADLDGIAGEL